MKSEDIDAMAEILQEYGVSVPTDIIEKITSDFIDHLDAMREMRMTPFMSSGGESDFQKALRLERELSKVRTELAKMSKENQVYHDSAMRRLNASDVWIEDNTIKNGCSVCQPGKENYTTYATKLGRKKVRMYQYDYRTESGELFSCCAPTLETCRERRDKWLSSRQ